MNIYAYLRAQYMWGYADTVIPHKGHEYQYLYLHLTYKKILNIGLHSDVMTSLGELIKAESNWKLITCITTVQGTRRSIIDSVESICRDRADTQYMLIQKNLS